MNTLVYSPAALNVLAAFHNVEWVIFVEGVDDVVFWSHIFRRSGITDVHFKPVGGGLELDKYMRAIVDYDAKVVVARDRDYRGLCGKIESHERVIWTLGYSIENHLYSPVLLAAALAVLARSTKEDVAAASAWLNEFAEGLRECVIRDLANCLGDSGVRVMGDNAVPFLKRRRSVLNGEVAMKRCQEADARLPKRNIARARKALDGDTRPAYLALRGHFLTNAVLCFLEEHAKKIRGAKVSISKEHLFGQLISLLDARWNQCDVTWCERQLRGLRNEP